MPRAGEIPQKGVTVWWERDGTNLRERLVLTKPVSDNSVQRHCIRRHEIQLKRMHVRKYRKTAR